MEVEEEKP